MPVSLRAWLGFGWLKEHKSSPREIADLFAVADRDLRACQTPGLVPDWQLNIAYNAALQLASIALAAEGFAAERVNHHFRVIHSLEFTLGLDATSISKFDLSKETQHHRL
jgi:hypothetical protein